ncbi:hypothetical protein WCE55_02255 [Luteimonas sp. MJ293]|uniref:hypothetical protein n=1 Tax=Luteimonas sp. MJ146 TaxID=3129240 RepID=UPI0031BAC20D
MPAKTKDDELRDQITDALVRDVGVSQAMAAPFVESIMQCLAGQRVYFPAPVREPPLDEIRDALECGATAREVERHFGVSRRQLYRLFPGGLPRPIERA